jgi:DNA-binding transcriptional ArsR family regulator
MLLQAPERNSGQASYTVSLDPARGALLSLALLTAEPGYAGVEPWVAQTAAGLTGAQRARNRLIFAGLGGALIPDADYPSFPAYLDAIAAAAPADLRERALHAIGPELDQNLLAEAQRLLADPPAMQDLIVGHLRELWELALGATWEQQLARLAGLVLYLEQRPLPAGSAADLIRAFIGRELPDSIAVQLGGVRHVAFVLTPHVRLHAERFGSPDTIWVFVLAHFPSLAVRAAPIRRGELLRPLVALADDSRLHILELLARHGELPTQEIIALLDQSQPNVSRHLKQLVAAGFVEELRGEGANKRYALAPQQLDATFWTLKRLLSAENLREAEPDARDDQPLALRRFLDSQARVTTWPAKRQSQELVLAYLVSKFERGREYNEREVNAILNQWHTYGDPATLRRDLYDAKLFDRAPDGTRYWRIDAGDSQVKG